MDRLLVTIGLIACPLVHAAETPPPAIDDATLRAVTFAGSYHGCAVGDLGAIWTTADGGATWSSRKSPIDGSHANVWFVNKNVGWIVGHRPLRDSKLSAGYVLATEDGGETWKLLCGDRGTVKRLPRLNAVRFFTTKMGIASGRPNRFFPTGVVRTLDGGFTWESVRGDTGDWTAAWYLHPAAGVLVGQHHNRALLKGESIQHAQNQLESLKQWSSVRLSATAASWLVGKGADVLMSTDAGLTWQPPPAPLPEAIRDFVDFRAVTNADHSVWLAGNPGSAIWHSFDGGRSWQPQPTPQSVPINALHAITRSHVCAVGDFGSIIRTTDGGKTWQAVRGADRHAALLVLSPRPARVPFGLLAKEAADQGYRTSVVLPSQDRRASAGDIARAVVEAGGCTTETGWRFPVDQPGLERDSKRLVRHWQRRTEGRLSDLLIKTLVTRIRSLRPEVIVLDYATEDDGVARVINDATLKAIAMAADATQFPEQTKLTALRPWKVKRIFRREPPASRGAVQITPYDYLQHKGTTVRAIVSNALAIVQPDVARSESLSFRGLSVGEEAATYRGLFRGLGIAPGSATRRPLDKVDPSAIETNQRIANQQRNIDAYVARAVTNTTQANAVIGQLDRIVTELPDDRAVMELVSIMNRFQDAQRWELVAATHAQIVRRFPRSAQAGVSREWLFHWNNGAEAIWQRVRKATISGSRRKIQLANFQQPAVTNGETGAGNQLRDRLLAGYREQATHYVTGLKDANLHVFNKPSLQIALAAFLRGAGQAGRANRILNGGPLGPFTAVARQEVWSQQKLGEHPAKLHLAVRAAERPLLDGILSDPCWEKAREMWLRGRAIDTSKGSFATTAWDDQFLYLAGAIAKHPGTEYTEPRTGGRTYDADLRAFDRVTWHIDIDRDYTTSYRLEIDQRGWTRDACWHDGSWNPKWYVAVDADESHWHFEAAIPFDQIAAQAPGRNHIWAVGVSRTVPGEGTSAWGRTNGVRIEPSDFGLMQFR